MKDCASSIRASATVLRKARLPALVADLISCPVLRSLRYSYLIRINFTDKDYVTPCRTLAVLFAITRSLSAQEQPRQLVQELIQSEAVYPQGRDEVQLTLLPTLSWNHSARSQELPVALEYGLSENWQVGMGWTSLTRTALPDSRERYSRGELEVGVKRSFMAVGGSNNHLALGFEADVSNGNGEGAGRKYEPFFVFARDVARGRGQVFAHSAFNLGRIPQSLDDDDEIVSRTNTNAGLLFKVGWVVLTNEWSLAGERWNLVGGRKAMSWTPGVVLRLPVERSCELAVGTPIGLNNQGDRLRLVVKLTYEFEGLFGSTRRPQ
jgi:hypothetical protein